MFEPDDRGARRTYLFRMNDDHEPRPELLEGQLAAARLYWKDNPAICEMRRMAGLKAELLERTDTSPPQ